MLVDYIDQTVAVDVINADFRSAGPALRGAPAAEGLRMVGPKRLRTALGRLFPPAIAVDVIHESVAIDVAHADSMTDIDAPRTRIGDDSRNPWLGDIGGIGLRVSQEQGLGGMDEFRLTVAVDIGEYRRFVSNRGEYLRACPSGVIPPSD